MMARDKVQRLHRAILDKLSSAASQHSPLLMSLRSLDKERSDLHVHLIGPECFVNHSLYVAPIFISLVSLMLGRRSVHGDRLGVLGDVQHEGKHFVCIIDLNEADVRACYRQGLRQLIVPCNTVFKEGALAVASQVMEDGLPMVEFLRYANILDTLAFIFYGDKSPR